METAMNGESEPEVAPECVQLVETIETLIDYGQRDQAASVMRLMRRCISLSDCPHVETCNAALCRFESMGSA